MNALYDLHVHWFTGRAIPKWLQLEKLKINLKHIQKLAYETGDSLLMKGTIGAYNAFAKKDLNREALLKQFFISDYEYREELMKLEPDHLCLMSLDLGKEESQFLGEADWKIHQTKVDNLLPGKKIYHIKGIAPWRIQNSAGESLDQLTSADGLKVYPATWSVPPNIARQCFMRLTAFSEKHGIPLFVHCSPGGIGKQRQYSDPINWFKPLGKHPLAKIVFLHSGRRKEWEKRIILLAMEYPGVFAETGFHEGAIFNSQVYFDWLKRFQEAMWGKVGFGGDYPLFLAFYIHQLLMDKHREYLSGFEQDLLFTWAPDMILNQPITEQ